MMIFIKKISSAIARAQLLRLAVGIIVFFSLSHPDLYGQKLLIDRKTDVELTKKALDQIYSFQFNEAEETILLLRERLGDYPGIDLLNAVLVFWKHLPLKKGTIEYKKYEEYLNSAARLAEEMLRRNNQDAEGIFFSLAAYGNLASYYADEGSIMKALGNARKAYASLKKGFNLKDEYAEFYFTTGLYNYYREKYPEKNPIYKPFTWFFERGDKKLGIQQIRVASDKAIFTNAEADYYLFHIHLRYEKDPASALVYARKLHKAYPSNLVFQAYLAESLIFSRQFEEAEGLVKNLLSSETPFFKIPGNLFQAMLLENNNNLKEAERKYNAVLELAETENFDMNYYRSLSFAGLARIADKRGDKTKAREYYGRASKLSSYDIVTDEARAYGQ
jgi:tetratricopeptide (TPR) repeat protein